MKDKIKWGILSTGKIAHKFAEDLIRVESAELQAVGSRNLKKAQEFAQRFDVPNAFGSYDELAEFDDIDVVYIGSPHSLHIQHSILCLKNNKHVLCEKPMGINQQEVHKMIQVAQDNQRFLMEAMWTRFFPFFESMSEIVDSGEIGDIKFIEADFGFSFDFDASHRLFDPSLGGGALLDVGIYPVFIAIFLLGKPKEIRSLMSPTQSGVDETITIQMSWQNGIIANLIASVGMDTRCEAKIVGTRKTIHIPRRWHEADRILIMEGEQIFKEIGFTRTCRGYLYEIHEVNRCISEGRLTSSKMPLELSLLISEVLDEIRTLVDLRYPQDITF